MNKTAEQNILDFLRSNPSKWASAGLQRMEWKNRNGTLAAPRTVVRRLEENVWTPENLKGILEVSYDDHNNAWYQVKQKHIRRVEKREVIIRNGERVAILV